MPLLAALFSLVIHAQDSTDCATPDMDTTDFYNLPWFDNNQLLEDFLDSIGYPNASMRIVDQNIRYWIPLKLWIYWDDNGNGGPSQLQVQAMIDNLNRLFNEVNNIPIAFYMKCDPSYINNIGPKSNKPI